jgi:hypothetical protein
MHHAFGDALAVEVADLLEEMVVLQRGWPAGPTVRWDWLSVIGCPWRSVNSRFEACPPGLSCLRSMIFSFMRPAV